MASRQKPTNNDELLQDIESHPERGKLNGEDVVRFDTEDLQVSIPKELYRILLEIGGSMGLNKKEIVMLALTRLATDPGVLALLERSHSIKAEKYGVSPVEIRSKVFGAYKRVGREKSSRIAKGSLRYKTGDEG